MDPVTAFISDLDCVTGFNGVEELGFGFWVLADVDAAYAGSNGCSFHCCLPKLLNIPNNPPPVTPIPEAIRTWPASGLTVSDQSIGSTQPATAMIIPMPGADKPMRLSIRGSPVVTTPLIRTCVSGFCSANRACSMRIGVSCLTRSLITLPGSGAAWGISTVWGTSTVWTGGC